MFLFTINIIFISFYKSFAFTFYSQCFSYQEVIQKTGISNEAQEYIKDNSLFHYGFGPVQSLENFPKTRRGFDRPKMPTDLPEIITVPTGMNSYPSEFMRQFLSSNPFRYAFLSP